MPSGGCNVMRVWLLEITFSGSPMRVARRKWKLPSSCTKVDIMMALPRAFAMQFLLHPKHTYSHTRGCQYLCNAVPPALQHALSCSRSKLSQCSPSCSYNIPSLIQWIHLFTDPGRLCIIRSRERSQILRLCILRRPSPLTHGSPRVFAYGKPRRQTC